MQQQLPQPPMAFPVKHENLQDSYYQTQLNQQQSMAPISPPVGLSSPPTIQIPAPRSPPIGKIDEIDSSATHGRSAYGTKFQKFI